MDPSQPDNSFGGLTDAPTPEVTPTPEVVPVPESVVPIEPTLDAPVLAPEPVAVEQPVVDPTLTATPTVDPIETMQPTEPVAPVTPEVTNPVDATNQVDPVSTPAPNTAQTAETAPVNTTPVAPTQPAVGGIAVPTTGGAPTNTPPKSKKGLIIGLVAGIGGLVIIGVAVILFLFVFNGGGTIGSVADLKQAIKDKKAINCTVSKDGQDVLIQTNDGWSKMRMNMDFMGYDMNVLAIEGDSTYMWTDDGKMAYKSDYDNSITSSTSNIDEEANEEGIELECEPNNKADFSVPDMEFTDAPSSSFNL